MTAQDLIARLRDYTYEGESGMTMCQMLEKATTSNANLSGAYLTSIKREKP